jgi:hypothetical protein
MDEKVYLEVGRGISEDLLKRLKDLQDKYYREQVVEHVPEKKDKILRNFMNVTNMIQVLEEWQLQENK